MNFFSNRKINLKELDLKIKMDIGAPSPTIISDEHNLFLMFYIDTPDPNWDGTYVNIRDVSKDQGIACVTFKSYLQIINGWPNEEVSNGHRYFKYGLTPFGFFEVINSDWIEEIKKRNSVHPYHNDKMFEDDKHYIFFFHDSCFEVIAREFETEVYHDKTMKEVCELKMKKLFE